MGQPRHPSDNDINSSSSSSSRRVYLPVMKYYNDVATPLLEPKFEPCRVCGEQSSGWHCGAVTCEACKKFFLRSIHGEDAKYRCTRNRQCVIVRSTRTQCQYCRFQKCREVGMTNESPVNPTVNELFKSLGCCVCLAPASGIHFGVISCEGCKGFFRRSIKERAPEKYKCSETGGNCEINATNRNMCRFCRYKRCVEVGMNVKGSRIGRQSNLFKHKILELKSGNMHLAQVLVGQQKTSKQRIKSEAGSSATGTAGTMTTTTMMATNLSMMTTSMPNPSSSTAAINRLNPTNSITSGSGSSAVAECEMLNLNYQQRTTTSTNMANNSGLPNASYLHQQAPQQIIAVNQFTTNQYIINTGGQPVMNMSAALTSPDNLMKLTASNTTVLGAASGHFAANPGAYYSNPAATAASTAPSWYNDFNLDLNNNQIGSGMSLNQLRYTLPKPAIMPSQTATSSSQLILPTTSSSSQALSLPASTLPLQPLQTAVPVSSHSSLSAVLQLSGAEDEPSFTPESRDLIKSVYRSYMNHMRPDLLNFTNSQRQQQQQQQQRSVTLYNNSYAQYTSTNSEYGSQSHQTLNDVLAYFEHYVCQLKHFLANIPEFNELSESDQKELVRSSIHSVVVFVLHRGCAHLNYFNVEPNKLGKFLHAFPCFDEANAIMKKVRDKFEKYRLDDREIALYIAVLAFTTANKNLEKYELINKTREKLGTALNKYMSTRREEEIMCDEIILFLNFFKQFNQKLQNQMTVNYLNLRQVGSNQNQASEFDQIERLLFWTNRQIN